MTILSTTIKRLVKSLLSFRNAPQFENGHFYSPITNIREVSEVIDDLWCKDIDFNELRINFNHAEQDKILEFIQEIYPSIPHVKGEKGLRYSFENGQYSYTDAIFLHSMIRYLKPKKIVEVGSGHSSAMMLDTNEKYFNEEIQLDFIEPYPNRLLSILKQGDKQHSNIIVKKVQTVDNGLFENLSQNDILFIDSSHISKTASDLNHILFEILPKISKGVYLHFHDIFYPFEYPPKWVKEGRNWNEVYLLKSFLMSNNDYEIVLFSDYLKKKRFDVFGEIEMCQKNTGANLWLKKLN